MQYHTKWKITEENDKKIILTDKLEIHIIELPKVSESEENKEELIDWLTFLENPNSERVKEKMEENEELKQAVEKLNEISEDEHMQRIAELREKAIRDEKSIRITGLEEGREEGREIGIEEGRKEGRKEGIKEGIKQGKKEAKIEDAKKMLEEGIALELVMKITGLTKEEIEN